VVSDYVKDPGDMLARAKGWLGWARRSGMTVIHVRVGFRPDFPEVNHRNVPLNAIKTSPQRRGMFEGPAGEIHPAAAPEGGDIVGAKHQVDAFVGTDLEMILRANEIDTLVMFGIASSGVTLSTLLHAFDLDFRTAVIKDCCADLDPEAHDCLVEKIFPRRSAVMTAEEFVDLLDEPDSV
jgi:nicotinamidase-related amidase